MRERHLDVGTGDILGPADHPVVPLAFRHRRNVETLHQVLHELLVLLGDHPLDLIDQILGGRAVDIHPLQLDLQLFGTEAHRPQHPKATSFRHRDCHIAAVGEGKDRVLDFEHVAELRSHDNFPLLVSQTPVSQTPAGTLIPRSSIMLPPMIFLMSSSGRPANSST